MMKAKKSFSLLVFSLLNSCELNPSIFSNKGNFDTVAPSCLIDTTIPDPVLTDSVLCYATFSKGPITGFASGDVTLTNCTLSDFTQISHNRWSFILNPTIDGTFTAKINAGTCNWTANNGASVANVVSNTLSKTYDSGASYDLQNSAEISKLQHFRGHAYSITHCNDLLSVTSVPGMELLHSKYNFGVTHYANGNNIMNQNIFDFGRCDFGVISISYADFLTREALVTALRDGAVSTVSSYKNGDDSYSASMIPVVLNARNSNYGGVPPSYTFIAYTGLTATDLSTRGVSFRHDYFQKVTTTSYYVSTQAIGDSRLASYIAQVISTSGWYSDFVHWHWQVGNYPKHYLQQLITAIGATDAFRGTVNQVAEYYFVKESVDSVSGNGNTITINHTKDFGTSPYTNITTPLWIKLNTTGTVFAGQDIALSNGLRPRRISANVFYVPVVLDYSGNQTTVQVGIATVPSYVNLNQPIPMRAGNAVTCDQEVKYTVWRVAKPTALASSVTSATIPTTDNTTVNLTVSTGLTIPAGTQVRVLADGSNYFYANVTSYTSGTGALVLSSFPDAVGSGDHSNWTITRYYHELEATEVDRSFTFASSYTILATLDEVNYTYHVGVINRDGISNAIP